MQTFHIKDHRHLTNFLGLEITKLYKGISIHIQKYAEDLKFMAQLTKSQIFDITLELDGRKATLRLLLEFYSCFSKSLWFTLLLVKAFIPFRVVGVNVVKFVR